MNQRLQAASDQLADKILGAVGEIAGRIVDGALDSLLDDSGDSDYTPSTAAASGDGTKAVQDTVDCLRRFIRYSKESHSASKQERNVARRSIKAVKQHFPIVSGDDDVFTENGLD
jgi:hypothetical protein